MSGSEANIRKGMERTRLRKPSRTQYKGTRPVDPALLDPAAKSNATRTRAPALKTDLSYAGRTPYSWKKPLIRSSRESTDSHRNEREDVCFHVGFRGYEM
jgi:hypothetical protein